MNTAVKRVYIDLPGQQPKLPAAKNIEVVLRNCRDVVLDINTGSGGALKVFATEDEFYIPKKKTLYKPGYIYTVKDGSEIHLQISRHFKGDIVVKKGKTVVLRLPVSKMDKTKFGTNPKDTPAPIMIRMDKNAGVTVKQPDANPPKECRQFVEGAIDANNFPAKYRMRQPTGRSRKQNDVPIPMRHPDHVYNKRKGGIWDPLADKGIKPIPLFDPNALYTVVQVITLKDIKDMPKHLWRHFQRGGKTVITKEIDPHDVVSRNWLYEQVAATSAYVATNWEWLKSSARETANRSGKHLVRIHLVKRFGKYTVYFSGMTSNNPFFKRGVQGIANAAIVLPITQGAGSMKGVVQSLGAGTKGAFKGNALFSFVFSSATDYAEWQNDASKDGYDLTATLLVNVVKALAIAAGTVILTAVTIIGFVAAGFVSAPVIVMGAITIAAGIAASWIVDRMDKGIGKAMNGTSDGIAGVLSPILRDAGQWIAKTYKKVKPFFKERVWLDIRFVGILGM